MRVSVDELINELQRKYNELAMDNNWEVGTNAGQHSVFSCFSCGKQGHMWRDCPSLDEAQVQTKLQGMLKQPSGGRGGRGSRGGRGIGRGRVPYALL